MTGLFGNRAGPHIPIWMIMRQVEFINISFQYIFHLFRAPEKKIDGNKSVHYDVHNGVW